ncbi:MAG: hypothetical protein A2358_01780 [Candidatus Staskawiczbacteria bacterium RIFOXYB1_FULL_37_44]|uniref:Uncharacterized protein n=1 Tax=Candidatus Staskawiczbacteria bacterium RIFOXYB1_FULL_37_44 TaxID=1802223 RepID=A0A1G2IUR5_9BACT|nr:MAG: hypothetical protein A2358_01780 [Candidatus Staskawiczbacteria bacterium RIFOXYB1_FULL_37_44]
MSEIIFLVYNIKKIIQNFFILACRQAGKKNNPLSRIVFKKFILSDDGIILRNFLEAFFLTSILCNKLVCQELVQKEVL